MAEQNLMMEFLTVYGWAILLVLASFGALWYYGIFSPDNLRPVKIDSICCQGWCESLGEYDCAGFDNLKNKDGYIRCMGKNETRHELVNGSNLVIVEDSIIYYITDVERVCNGS